MARANARYWPSVLPAVQRELRLCLDAADSIPSDRLRQIALAKLAEESFNAEVAATLGTLAARPHRSAVIRAIVSLQVMFDYLDGLSEVLTDEPLASSRRLHSALADAVTLAPLASDGYHHEPSLGDDGGYLEDLVRASRESFATLPQATVVGEVARLAAERCGEAQSRTHAIDTLGLEQLVEWATAEARHTELTWWEYAAGGTASILAVHAQVAAAADPLTTATAAATLDRSYVYICAISTLLDSVVDYESDLEAGLHSFIDYYEDEAQAAAGVGRVIANAVVEAEATRHAAHHVMTAAGVAAYYLSAPTADRPPGPAIKRRAGRELGPLMKAALAVFRLWRLGKTAAGRRRRA